jgi:DNA-3-methyladenine glycosylase II
MPDGGKWLVTVYGHKVVTRPLVPGGSEPTPTFFTFPTGAGRNVPQLCGALMSLGSVARFRTPDLWDAIGTAIIRQVIRAGHAKRLYRAFCDAYGERCGGANQETYALFPTPETVLDLSDTQFSAVGLTFKRRALRTAAEAYLKHTMQWRDLPPAVLVRELQQVPRIGAWTAGATVADFSNDFTHYPYADLAIRTWANRAAPSYSWPDDELAFARCWTALAGDQVGSLTLFTLAWGAQHGDTT